MRRSTIGTLSGVARPSKKLRAISNHLYGDDAHTKTVQQMLDDLVPVDALSRLITEGINKVTTKDGRLDSRELAAFILQRMKKDG